MAASEIKHVLVCRDCGKQGLFVYRKIGGRFQSESLSPGFRFKDTGYATTSTIACASCGAVVFGPSPP